MHKNRYFLLITFICAFLYIGALSYFMHFYNEERWMPKVVLDLPALTQPHKTIYSNPSNVFPNYNQNENFHILFDTTPLPNVEMIRSWDEETNAVRTYAKPFFDEKLPKLSIVLTEVGLNEDLFAKAIHKLPTAITLSFSPYALSLDEKIKYARQNGFENMMDLPVEKLTAYANAGQYALSDDLSASDVSELLKEHYLGMNVPFIGFYLNGIVSQGIWKTYEQNITPYGLISLSVEEVDRNYQSDFYQEAIEKALNQAEKKAVENGDYIIVFPMHPLVVDVIAEWVGLRFHPNVSFVPLSGLKRSLL